MRRDSLFSHFHFLFTYYIYRLSVPDEPVPRSRLIRTTSEQRPSIIIMVTLVRKWIQGIGCAVTVMEWRRCLLFARDFSVHVERYNIISRWGRQASGIFMRLIRSVSNIRRCSYRQSTAESKKKCEYHGHRSSTRTRQIVCEAFSAQNAPSHFLLRFLHRGAI